MARECGCPEWVVRCLHFDGEWIVLHRRYTSAWRYAVCRGTGLVDSGNDYYHTKSNIIEDYLTLEEGENLLKELEMELLYA